MNVLLKKVASKLAAMLVLSILIGCIAPASTEKTGIVYAAENMSQGAVSKVFGDGFTLELTVAGAHAGGYTVNAVLTNTGESVLRNWAISFEHQGEITQIWNAKINYLST